MDTREIQESWETLWQFLDGLAGATILAWATQHNVEAFTLPAHADWPHGLVLISWPSGSHAGFPLDARGLATRSRALYLEDGQWADLGRQCLDQYHRWAGVVHHWNMAPLCGADSDGSKATEQDPDVIPKSSGRGPALPVDALHVALV